MIKIIFWDFDGVIMNSNAVRDKGFEEVLKDFPKSEVEQLMVFHRENGGLSRYVKFRYFFEKVRGEQISENEVNQWAQKFSKIMLSLLINQKLLIEDTTNFIKQNFRKYSMHIVSGSDQTELRQICKGVNIDQYFKSIHGSPTPKNNLVKSLLEEHHYDKNACVLIGDSKNDLEAAKVNGIHFMGYGNASIIQKTNFKLF